MVAIVAAKLSFSPISSSNSSMATVSFSLTIGITPCSIMVRSAFCTFCFRSSSRIYLVTNTCATVKLYCENNLSYRYINSHCPTAAHACLSGISFGFCVMPSFAMPSPTEPLDTIISSLPSFCRSASAFTSCSTRRIFKRPVLWVNVEVPNLMTTRFFAFTSIIFLPRSRCSQSPVHR